MYNSRLFTLLLVLSAVFAANLSAQRPERFVLSDSVVLFDVGFSSEAFPSLIYMTDAEGVYVRRFVNSYARVHPRPALSFSIDQVYSPQQGVKLRISDVRPSGEPVSLRICKPSHPYRIYLNGHEGDFPSDGGYIVLRRVWAPQDEVWMDMDEEIGVTLE